MKLFNLFALIGVIAGGLATSRLHSVTCPVCDHTVVVTSWVEDQFSPLGEIPTLHVQCENLVVTYLAPNCFMTATEWLSVRGYHQERLAGSDKGSFTVIGQKKHQHKKGDSHESD